MLDLVAAVAEVREQRIADAGVAGAGLVPRQRRRVLRELGLERGLVRDGARAEQQRRRTGAARPGEAGGTEDR